MKRIQSQQWSYARKFAAHYRNEVVTIPDQIAVAQRQHDLAGTRFPVRRADGSIIRVKLDGDAYGLHGAGMGDPIVKK